jgi:hypothetical protein
LDPAPPPAVLLRFSSPFLGGGNETQGDIRQLRGFETLMEVQGFLKDHGAFLPHTSEDLAHDTEVARRVAQRDRLVEGQP